MKVLGHIHTFNDEDVIDQCIQAVMAQTYPVEEILIVDNASIDKTLDRKFPDKVHIIRHDENTGTNGSVNTGMKYALEKDHDWIWILDADTLPLPDALEKLVRLYEGFPPELQEKTWTLSCLPKEERIDRLHHGVNFNEKGVYEISPDPDAEYYECDANMWTGSMYKLETVKEIGLPELDYVLDWGDVIYGYIGMRRGYKGFIHQSSIVLHNLHPMDTLHYLRFGIRKVKVFWSPPIRFYYLWRNSTYFWLHLYHHKNFFNIVLPHLFNFLKWMIKATLFIKKPGPILWACVRGFWDGLFKKLHNRY